MVKKLKHLKTLKTVVEYQAHVECWCGSVCFQNVVWYLEDLTHPKLGAIRHFVHFCCIVYVLCMLAEVPGDMNMMHSICIIKMPVVNLCWH